MMIRKCRSLLKFNMRQLAPRFISTDLAKINHKNNCKTCYKMNPDEMNTFIEGGTWDRGKTWRRGGYDINFNKYDNKLKSSHVNQHKPSWDIFLIIEVLLEVIGYILWICIEVIGYILCFGIEIFLLAYVLLIIIAANN